MRFAFWAAFSADPTRACWIVLSRFFAMPMGRRGLPQSGTWRTAEVVQPDTGFAGTVTPSCHGGSVGIVSARPMSSGEDPAGGGSEGERGAGGGGASGGRNDLGGRIGTRMAGAVRPRRAERPGVTSVTSPRPPCGRRHICGSLGGGAGCREGAGIMVVRPRTRPGRRGIWVLGAANRVRKGGFSRSCESPSKAWGWGADGPELCTIRIQDTPGSDFHEFVAG